MDEVLRAVVHQMLCNVIKMLGLEEIFKLSIILFFFVILHVSINTIAKDEESVIKKLRCEAFPSGVVKRREGVE